MNTTAAPAAETPALMRKRNRWILGVVAVVAAVSIYNLTVWVPTSNAIRADGRNSGLGIHVYRTLATRLFSRRRPSGEPRSGQALEAPIHTKPDRQS